LSSVIRIQNSSTKARFNYEDAFDLESQLTDDERMVRDQFRSYCQEKLMPRIIEANRKEIFHPEIMRELGDLDLPRDQNVQSNIFYYSLLFKTIIFYSNSTCID